MTTQLAQDTEAEQVPLIQGIYHVNINVRNLERSRAFYEQLGFKVVEKFSESYNPNLDRGLAMKGTSTRAYFMRLLNNRHETMLDMVEWDDPSVVGEAPVMNSLGVPRLAFRVKYLDKMVEKLRANGVKFLSEPQVLDSLERKPRFCVFRDPDGIFLELVEF